MAWIGSPEDAHHTRTETDAAATMHALLGQQGLGGSSSSSSSRSRLEEHRPQHAVALGEAGIGQDGLQRQRRQQHPVAGRRSMCCGIAVREWGVCWGWHGWHCVSKSSQDEIEIHPSADGSASQKLAEPLPRSARPRCKDAQASQSKPANPEHKQANRLIGRSHSVPFLRLSFLLSLPTLPIT